MDAPADGTVTGRPAGPATGTGKFRTPEGTKPRPWKIAERHWI
ncbi:MAG: hypothetical protein AVDCRST_MAG56-7355 [uncultured Cytophagales bacterium]|uniref:Uncharacterized protein n=1 Tax=uncultured Cytophagales bacterium TaxID=158755 RepID=A0A6J4LG16_9SPHI|nr:MAG: hypothetical protein AVDCRST_MAG56-7355 [uncultured Cytophagales bacterium]